MWSNSLQEEGTKIQQVCIVMEKKQIQTSVYKCLYRFFFFFYWLFEQQHGVLV